MTTTQVADIYIRAPDGSPIVAAEVTNPIDFSVERATDLHRYLVERGYAGAARFFLLLAQDIGYLWDHDQRGAAKGPPTTSFSMEPVVRRYWPTIPAGERLTSGALELLVIPWLYELADTPRQGDEEPEASLRPSGMLQAIAGRLVTVDADR